MSDSNIETVSVISGVDAIVNSFAAAKDLPELYSLILSLEASRLATGRSVTMNRAIKFMVCNNLLPGDFPTAYSSLGKDLRGVLAKAFHQNVGDGVLAGMKTAIAAGFCGGIGPAVKETTASSSEIDKVAFVAHIMAHPDIQVRFVSL
jgi:hypothetical protein